MAKDEGRRTIRPESEDRGFQASELRRRRPGQGRVPAGDEGVTPNPDASPVEETVGDTDGDEGQK
jgi:hypothetical protein